jgi:hypothetical protein
MQHKGVYEFRDLEQSEIKSAGAEYFLQKYRISIARSDVGFGSTKPYKTQKKINLRNANLTFYFTS